MTVEGGSHTGMRARLRGPVLKVWAKHDRDSDGWLPLWRHMEDSAAVAGRLWDEWLPLSVRRLIAAELPEGANDARRLVVWLAGVHDIGKATPAFACQVDLLAEAMRVDGLEMRSQRAMGADRKLAPHGLAGQVLLGEWLENRHGWAVSQTGQFTVAVGGHHGVPPEYGQITALDRHPQLLRTPGKSGPLWQRVQQELLEACAAEFGVQDRLGVSVLGETGAAVCWVGERGVRYYAGGRALTRSSALAEAQAARWANVRSRLGVARAMYRLRFPDEDPAGLTRHELLGREGRRLKNCYRAQSARTGVPWHGRRYTPGDFSSGDAVNQAITAAAQCMYGIAHAVVSSLGCSPALGFVHSGHELSFVLDVADLYKTEIGIPLAFDVAAEDEEDVGSRTRRALRDRINETSLLDRCVNDIKRLLLGEAQVASTATNDAPDVVTLQSDGGREVAAGRNYGGGEDFDVLETTW